MSEKFLQLHGFAPPGKTGHHNAITDVPGVEVGHCTLIQGQAIRTGVTVVLPQGHSLSCVPAASFALNGNGELTGSAWIEESGFLEGPIGLTNTCSVGVVRDSLRRWILPQVDSSNALSAGLLPVVGETWDGLLNDIEGQHLRAEHVFEALQNAAPGPLAEGNVGGGTGMVCYAFKGGIGSASRRIHLLEQDWHLGVLVQSNFGSREQLSIAGVPLGPLLSTPQAELHRPQSQDGSIIAVLATDAPLLPHQLKRLAKRMALGLARTGGLAHNSSGDFFLAFSTAQPQKQGLEYWKALPNTELDPLFQASAWATEEAILNALFAAQTLDGVHGNRVYGIPLDESLEHLQRWHVQLNRSVSQDESSS